MNRIIASILILIAGLSSAAWGAIAANTVWEVRVLGAQTNGGGFKWVSLVNASYAWTVSGSGTNEYYCRTSGGANPSLTASGSVTVDGNYNLASSGSVGSLAAGTYAWGDNDALGYTTLYVRLSNGLDPDTMRTRGQPGYVSYGGGGTDYSQQASAERTWLAAGGTYTNNLNITNATPSVVTSASYNFVAADIGNMFRFTAGTNVTPGWYQIVSVAANAATLDRNAMTGAPSADGSGYEGGAFLYGGSLDGDFQGGTAGGVAIGNKVWIQAGTYTLAENANTIADSGTNALRIYFIGYNGSRGDNPLADNRPLIDCLTYAYGGSVFGESPSLFANLRLTGTGTYVLQVNNTLTRCINIKAEQTDSGAGNEYALLYDRLSVFVGCEFSSAATGASAAACVATSATDQVTFLGCYIHDSRVGISTSAWTFDAKDCIFDTCTTGIAVANWGFGSVIGCTFFNCTTGFSCTGNTTITEGGYLVNNIFDTCTTGISAASSGWQTGYFIMNNCFYNTTDITNAGVFWPSNIFGDPGLNNPANGDFRIDSGDTNVYEQGVDVGTFTSAITYQE